MWPSDKIKPYPDSFVTDMHQSIVSTWTEDYLIRIFENDEDAARRFFFSSYIQGLIFYGPSELDAATAKFSERSVHGISALFCLFLKSSDEVLIGAYISPLEKWKLPKYLKSYFGIESDASNCLNLRLPLAQLLAAVYRMRLEVQLKEMSFDQKLYSESYYDYSQGLGLVLSPRLALAACSLSNSIFIEDCLSLGYSGEYLAKLSMARMEIFRSHSRDLLEAVVSTIQKYD